MQGFVGVEHWVCSYITRLPIQLHCQIIQSRMQLSTVAVHAGEGSVAGDPHPKVQGSAVFPIFQSATFHCDHDVKAGYGDVRYTRCNNNPSQQVVAAKLAALHEAEAALVTASGMAAITTTLMTFLSAGDHILVQSCLYGGTYTIVHETLPRMGIQVSQINLADPTSWKAQIQHNTKVVYCESIGNPLCDVPDLEAVVQLARQAGALAIIDNTFASPANFRPLTIGFDLVVESATKYLNGHSDVIAGCVVGSAVLINKVLKVLNHLGGSLDPHSCFLLQRGIKTLSLRVGRQNINALALATALEASPAVSKVHYPGLASHPRHSIARRLFTAGAGSRTLDSSQATGHAVRLAQALNRTSSMGRGGSDLRSHLSVGSQGQAGVDQGREEDEQAEAGYGGVLSFELHGGLKAAEAFLGALQVAMVAPSLGGVETLVVLPASTSHAGQSVEQRRVLGITDGLIRVAVGIEDTEDLLKDFLHAVSAAVKAVE